MTSIVWRSAVFICVTVLLTVVSWRPLHNPRSHGFYRYFAFVGITVLVLYNQPVWFERPFSPQHLLSWVMLLASVILVINSVGLLKKIGGRGERRSTPENLSFENTQNLVVDGLYRYIRHPMYTSLLLLAWGAFLKRIDPLTVAAAIVVTGALLMTARVEEQENIDFFGDDYVNYQKNSKMFIPYLF